MATMRRSLWNVPLAPLPASHDGFHQSATRGLPSAVDDQGGVVYGARDIYNRAINVSSPRFDGDDHDPESTTFRKKVVRRVEVPYTREVKVPATSTQLVDAMVQQPVTVRRHIAVPSTKLVEEPYTSYEEKDAVRDREVWVRQIVPERYKVRVPVQRTRVVEMPTTVIREVDQVVTVAVPTTRSVQVDGFRVDQVQDSKVMEVEEFQQYRMRPEPVGPPQPHTARELGRVPGARHLTRTPGPAVFHPEHPAVAGVQHDSPSASPLPYGMSTSRARGLSAPLSRVGTATLSRSLPYAAPAATRALPMASSSYYPSRPVLDARAAPTATYSRADPALNNNFTYGARALTGSARDSPSLFATQNVRAAGGFKKEASLTKTGADREADAGQYVSPPLGITVRGTHTRHTDGTGVLVSRVERASLAARAGLIDNDIITAVGGRPITTVDEFRSMLTRPDGAAVPVEFNRDGRKGVLVFVPRPGGSAQ